jgi:hypothetical protein
LFLGEHAEVAELVGDASGVVEFSVECEGVFEECFGVGVLAAFEQECSAVALAEGESAWVFALFCEGESFGEGVFGVVEESEGLFGGGAVAEGEDDAFGESGFFVVEDGAVVVEDGVVELAFSACAKAFFEGAVTLSLCRFAATISLWAHGQPSRCKAQAKRKGFQRAKPFGGVWGRAPRRASRA